MVEKQITKLEKINGCLNQTIWNTKYLNNETKIHIYKANVIQQGLK